MKYESSILKRLIDTYGVIGNPRYLSEIIKEFIVRGKELYPQLFTYQSDWLAHIDEFGLTPEYTVSYTGQYIYAPNTKEKPVKRAILKGSTKYRDIDTGEVLDAFEDGRNLELVSVKMPVLKNTGKNTFNIKNEGTNRADWHSIPLESPFSGEVYIKGSDSLPSDFRMNIRTNVESMVSNGEIKNGYRVSFINITLIEFYCPSLSIIGFTRGKLDEIIANGELEIKLGGEPYKSNILTVNEDVELRSNGSAYDELDLLTGKLTQRIDENGEVLSQEIVKTVDLTIHDKDHQKVERLSSFEGGTHFTTSSQDGSLLPTLTVDVVTDLEETLMVCSLDGNTM